MNSVEISTEKILKLESWLKLLGGILFIILFLFVLGPLYMKLPFVKPLMDVIEKEDINANGYYYTDQDEFSQAESIIRDGLDYPVGK